MAIRVTVVDQIGWIVIDRPQSRNAISKAMWDKLPVALKEIENAGAKVCIIRGEGPAFASGADLSELQKLDSIDKAAEHWLSIRTALNAVAHFSIPVIAMIVGPCMGGGCLLAAACDLRFCSSDAQFAVPVAQLGIKLDDANIFRLVSLIGRGHAMELLMTSAVINADRAQAIGLVNGIAAADSELEKLVRRAAESIKENVTESIKHLKMVVNSFGMQELEQPQELMVASYLSDEFRQRVARALSPKQES